MPRSDCVRAPFVRWARTTRGGESVADPCEGVRSGSEGVDPRAGERYVKKPTLKDDLETIMLAWCDGLIWRMYYQEQIDILEADEDLFGDLTIGCGQA